MARKKKSRFKARYLVILVVFYLMFRGWIALMPIKNWKINWTGNVSDTKKEEIRNLVQKTGVKSLHSLRSSIKTIDGVKDVRFKKGVTGILTIQVQPRVPIARVSDSKKRGLDQEGIVFEAEGLENLPVITIQGDSCLKDIQKALKILDVAKDLPIDDIKIGPRGVETRSDALKIIWGEGMFPKKYQILKRILKEGYGSKKRLDFRFDNLVVVRR